MSRIDDSWATDFDRISASPGRPLSASSMGTVTRDSTSAVELPRAMVWISTWGGANSGKTSTFDSGILASENAMNVAARKMTIQRKWRLRATIQRISVGPELELGAVDLWHSHGHHLRAVGRSVGQVDHVAVDVLDGDVLAMEGQTLRVHEDVRLTPRRVIQDGRVGDSVSLDGGRLQAD